MSTITEFLGLTQQATGENENAWGDVLNANVVLLEEKTSKITSKTITGGTTALTAAEAKVAVINLSGTLVSNAIVTIADNTKSAWVVNNATTGAYTVTFQTVSGTGGTIPQGAGGYCFSDGTNVTVVPAAVSALTSMLDVNGFSLGDGARKLLDFVEDGSAVNYIEIENEATGSGPSIRATGSDTDVDLNLEGKGTGLVRIGGSRVMVSSIVSKTGAYTILTADAGKMVDADASGGAFTLTLPTVATAGAGYTIGVKKTDSSSNAITVDGSGSETIDGAITLALSAQYDVVWLVCDGVEWFVSAIYGTTSNGGLATVTKSSAYTVTTSDFRKMFKCDATSAAFTLTLPAASSAGDGFEISVKKTDSSVNAITVDGNASETIDGATTALVDTQHHAILLRCDGSNWHIIAINGGSSTGEFSKEINAAVLSGAAYSIADFDWTEALIMIKEAEPSGSNAKLHMRFSDDDLVTDEASGYVDWEGDSTAEAQIYDGSSWDNGSATRGFWVHLTRVGTEIIYECSAFGSTFMKGSFNNGNVVNGVKIYPVGQTFASGTLNMWAK